MFIRNIWSCFCSRGFSFNIYGIWSHHSPDHYRHISSARYWDDTKKLEFWFINQEAGMDCLWTQWTVQSAQKIWGSNIEAGMETSPVYGLCQPRNSCYLRGKEISSLRSYKMVKVHIAVMSAQDEGKYDNWGRKFRFLASVNANKRRVHYTEPRSICFKLLDIQNKAYKWYFLLWLRCIALIAHRFGSFCYRQ